MDEYLEARTLSYVERTAKGLEYSTKKLEIVNEFAPDLLAEYEVAFEAHSTFHELLYNTLYGHQESYTIETMTAIEAELMTPREAAISLREYLVERREGYKALKDAYRAEIEPLDETNEANKLMSKNLEKSLE